MKPFIRLAMTTAVAVAVVGAFAAPAFADSSGGARAGRDHENRTRGGDHVVFVQTDNTAGNAIVAYDRANDGTLSLAGTYPSGGNGGQLTGSNSDHLASQGSLTYDDQDALLFAVNAGSNTVSVFTVRGDRLHLRQVVRSGGEFPISVAVHDDLVYVLNARNGGSVQGYGIQSNRLFPIPGSHRALGLDTSLTPEFTHTPGQVAFTPDGRQLVVTTKANGNDIDVFRVQSYGTLSTTPVVNAEAGAVPFAITFDRNDNLVIAETGINSLATFDLRRDGTVTQLASVPTGQSATCWVAAFNGQFYASNTGSAAVTRIQSGPHGSLTFLDNTTTDAGTVDASVSTTGHALYVQTGINGVVDEYHISHDGSLTAIGSVTVPNAIGGEGIVAF